MSAVGKEDIDRVKTAGCVQKGVEDPKLMHRPNDVGLLDDTHPVNGPFGIFLNDCNSMSLATKSDCGGQATYSATDNQDI